MNFAEQPPSKQWANLKFRGQRFAEVWFKPEGDPRALVFRLSQQSFHLAAADLQLTPEILLKAVNIALDDVESWQMGNVTHPAGAFELAQPLSLPVLDVVEIHIRLKPSGAGSGSASGHELTAKEWQDLALIWKNILTVEAMVDMLRVEVEGIETQMEAALARILTIEEKTHAPRADIALWTKAKNRVRFTLPKMREFTHRAVWALGDPDRKRLDEIYKQHIEPQVAFAEIGRLLPELESMQKNRQVLASQGQSVAQEAKRVANDVNTAYKMLQANAAANAKSKKAASANKGKFFKSVRKMSGADGK